MYALAENACPTPIFGARFWVPMKEYEISRRGATASSYSPQQVYADSIGYLFTTPYTPCYYRIPCGIEWHFIDGIEPLEHAICNGLEFDRAGACEYIFKQVSTAISAALLRKPGRSVAFAPNGVSELVGHYEGLGFDVRSIYQSRGSLVLATLENALAAEATGADFRPKKQETVPKKQVQKTEPQKPSQRPSTSSSVYHFPPIPVEHAPKIDCTKTGTVSVGCFCYVQQHGFSVQRNGKRYRLQELLRPTREFRSLKHLNRYCRKRGWTDVWFVA